ncbi:hypothetical protein BC834DRAFT_1040632 [Gloeopeniophorella convolvens]|nr:hypothetical protein BC834DRAFT_1040632 [Gloeopeniophorella convolvens]
MSLPVPQRYSPQFTPTPLPIPTRRPTHRAHPSFSDSSSDGSVNSTTHTHLMTQNPYQDADEDPLQALCHALNVAAPAPLRAAQLTKTHDLAVLQRTAPVLPTHLLALHDAPLSDPASPLALVPIDLAVFARMLRTDLTGGVRALPRPPTLPRLPLPPRLTLPVLPLAVPHLPSAPLLLLYALGVRRDPSALAGALLPLAAAAEFPAGGAMAQALARACARDDARLARYAAHNHGAWKNVLALGVRDTRVLSVVQTVWNVTAEGRRLWAREHAAAAPPS